MSASTSLPGWVTLKEGDATWKQWCGGGGSYRKHLARGKIYELPLLREIRARYPEGTALDVGAQYGGHSMYLSLVCGLRVIAFEADRERVQKLRETVTMNSANVTVVGCALGAEQGTASFVKDSAYMTLQLDPAGRVPVDAADALEAQHTFGDVTLIKLDIEGMEPQALAGMRDIIIRNRPLIYAEAHTPEALAAQANVLTPLRYYHAGTVQMGSRMVRWEHAS